MATHSSTLAWRIPWTEEPGRLQSMGSQRVRHDFLKQLHFTSLQIIKVTSLYIQRTNWWLPEDGGKGFPGSSEVKNLSANAGNARDTSLIPELGRYPGEGNGNPLQHSCLRNPTNRRAWRTTVHRVAKSQTRLSNWAHTHRGGGKRDEQNGQRYTNFHL